MGVLNRPSCCIFPAPAGVFLNPPYRRLPFGAGASALNRCRGFLFIEVLRGLAGCAVTRRRAGACPGIHEGARAVSDGRQALFYRPSVPSALFRNKGARCGLMASARVSFSPAAGWI